MYESVQHTNLPTSDLCSVIVRASDCLKELKEFLPMTIIAIGITNTTPRQIVQPTATHDKTFACSLQCAIRSLTELLQSDQQCRIYVVLGKSSVGCLKCRWNAMLIWADLTAIVISWFLLTSF